MTRVLLAALIGSAALVVAPSLAAPPTLYSTAAYESPVRADPDDLLLLPGYGFASGDAVVYRAIADPTRPLIPPDVLPTSSNESLGVADIVSVADLPYSLTIHLPVAMRSNQSYAIWVVNSSGEWSNGIKINDARPLWITPDEVFSSAASSGLSRVLKVVGRSLQPATGSSTQVRLVGALATYTLSAIPGENRFPTINRYVTKVQLPANMREGAYSVQVSRDGLSWVGLENKDGNATQLLRVLGDPATPRQFTVGDYSFAACIPRTDRCPTVRRPCMADSTADDDETQCIAAAVDAAAAAGGGVVKFGAGHWNMSSPGVWTSGQRYSSKGIRREGLVVPDGVSLEGAGSAATLMTRGETWDLGLPSFVLQGHNTVSGFTFRDARVYQNKDRGTALLMLGVASERQTSTGKGAYASVDHITITDNIFDKPYIAIGNDGLAIDHLVITNNLFGAFRTALFWEGGASNTDFRYRYSDSIVAHNTFFPGSYLNTSIGQGTIASELSGSYRVDFSENVADGTSVAYLYHPEADVKGWRAAYFWSLHDSVEMLLVSQNSATCTGDKDGDGEAISYDNNHNRPEFLTLTASVVTASSDKLADTSTVTLKGALIETQLAYGKAINVNPVTKYYAGDWLQIVQGPGVGQARRITAIATGSNADGETVTFTVTPALDVLPQSNSLVTGGRLYWQTYTVDNVIDQRTPLCLKSNPTRKAGGIITLYGPTADSVVEGNTQYDTSGIQLAHQFQLVDAAARISFPNAFAQSFNEIRDNLISGTYDDQDRTAQAEYGIAVIFAATPDTAPPPTLSYGLTISHNIVERSAGPRGAISFNQGWYTGPRSREFQSSTPWKVADATLLFRNSLTDVGQHGATRVGIGVSADNSTTPIEWHSALYGNVCHLALSHPFLGLVDLGTQTVRYCPSVTADSCECPGYPTDLGVINEQGSASATVGSSVIYTLVVTNNGRQAATGATLSATAPAGLAIDSMSGAGIACDAADPTVDLCHLGNMDAGATVRVEVRATIRAPGPMTTIFTVAHKEADTDVNNDSVGVVTIGTSRVQ